MDLATLLTWCLDLLLGGVLLWIGWSVLRSSQPFTAVVLFISFGLVLSILWFRLRAPDVAVAEAVIGAGLAGALFLRAIRRMGHGVSRAGDSW